MKILFTMFIIFTTKTPEVKGDDDKFNALILFRFNTIVARLISVFEKINKVDKFSIDAAKCCVQQMTNRGVTYKSQLI